MSDFCRPRKLAMLQQLCGETNIGRRLRHLVDESHLANHQRQDRQPDGDARENDEAHPGDLCKSLQLDQRSCRHGENWSKVAPYERKCVILLRLVAQIAGCGRRFRSSLNFGLGLIGHNSLLEVQNELWFLRKLPVELWIELLKLVHVNRIHQDIHGRLVNLRQRLTGE